MTRGIVPHPRACPAKASLAAALRNRREAGLPENPPAEGEAWGDPAPIRARIPVSPPAGDPASDPAGPGADFEARQAPRVLSLLRAGAARAVTGPPAAPWSDARRPRARRGGGFAGHAARFKTESC